MKWMLGVDMSRGLLVDHIFGRDDHDVGGGLVEVMSVSWCVFELSSNWLWLWQLDTAFNTTTKVVRTPDERSD